MTPPLNITEVDLDRADDAELAELAAACLARLTPGRQPLALFTQLCRLAVSATVEVTLLRRTSTGVQALLSRRPDSCPWWPGQWHVPGTVLLATDGDEAGGFNVPIGRMLDAEFAGAVELRSVPRAYDVRRRSGVRGSEVTAFCWAFADVVGGAEQPQEGRFMYVQDVLRTPPEGGLVEGHVETLTGALTAARIELG